MELSFAIKLLIKHKVPDHIILHSYKVAKIVWIISNELDIENKELCLCAALLHDITKYQSILNRGEDHSFTGGKLLRKYGFDDIAEIIESHVVLKNLNYLQLEKEIVFYADKRVKHDKIVSLEERFEDLKNRYGFSDKITEGFRIAKRIENKLESLGIKTKFLKLLD